MISTSQLTAPRTIPWWICVLGLLALYVPTLADLIRNIWTTEEQSQGPIVLAIVVWLIWWAWPRIDDPQRSAPNAFAGWLLIALALLLYVFGRSQRILSAQTLSAVLM